jgi:hypothetical protein
VNAIERPSECGLTECRGRPMCEGCVVRGRLEKPNLLDMIYVVHARGRESLGAAVAAFSTEELAESFVARVRQYRRGAPAVDWGDEERWERQLDSLERYRKASPGGEDAFDVADDLEVKPLPLDKWLEEAPR